MIVDVVTEVRVTKVKSAKSGKVTKIGLLSISNGACYCIPLSTRTLMFLKINLSWPNVNR